MMDALLATRMFHLFFKKGKRARRIVVILLIVTYLLNHSLLYGWK